MANALPLGHRKVVNLAPYPEGTLGDSFNTSISSKIMVESPRSFGRGNSDHEKQKTDTGVLCALQHFEYSDPREAVLHNGSNSVDILEKRNHS